MPRSPRAGLAQVADRRRGGHAARVWGRFAGQHRRVLVLPAPLRPAGRCGRPGGRSVVSASRILVPARNSRPVLVITWANSTVRPWAADQDHRDRRPAGRPCATPPWTGWCCRCTTRRKARPVLRELDAPDLSSAVRESQLIGQPSGRTRPGMRRPSTRLARHDRGRPTADRGPADHPADHLLAGHTLLLTALLVRACRPEPADPTAGAGPDLHQGFPPPGGRAGSVVQSQAQ